METWSLHQLTQLAEDNLHSESVSDLRLYAQRLMHKGLPVIFSLKHLSIIAGVNYKFLRDTVNRKRESANYRVFSIQKRSGGRRFIHALSDDLQETQRFLNIELLQKVPVHPNSYAFHTQGGVRKCAAAHCRAKWIIHFDIENFFYRINERDVYGLFLSLGYRPLLSMELARICTTINLPQSLRHFLRKTSGEEDHYKFYFQSGRAIGVLPQGSPTSPMISNLVAHKLDEALADFAMRREFVVTRYADDITLSIGKELPKGVSISNIVRSIVSIIRTCGFRENHKKTRVAGPGSRKAVLGLLVDGNNPRISRETYKRIERYLYASLKFGVVDVATHEKFDSAVGFYNHLWGLVNFVNDVDSDRGRQFKEQFEQVKESWKSEWESAENKT